MLQGLPGTKYTSYAHLYQLYIQFVRHHNTIIVIDGYGGSPSNKDETHYGKTVSDMGTDANFTPDMPLTMQNKQFLANPRNKQKCIDLLGSLMEKEKGIQVKHSPGDAMSVCTIALRKYMVVVRYDTDFRIPMQYLGVWSM